jgi:AraC-like DNA-binding protein
MRINNNDVVTICAVRDHLMDSSNTKISIPNLAKKFLISEGRLTKGYKILFNRTIKQHHLQMHMAFAMSELQQGAFIKELAYRLGYSNPKSFARAFKSVHLIAPQALMYNTSKD